MLIVDGEERLIEPLPKPAVARKKEQKQIAPDLWLASGEMTPFELQLRFGDGETVAVVRGDLLGRIELEGEGEEQTDAR